MRLFLAFKAFFKILFNASFAQSFAQFWEKEGQPAPAPAASPHLLVEPGAVQVLALLQREGRLIDFLQEDIEKLPNAQVGEVVRSTVYAGCRKALRDYLEIEPIRQEEENSQVEVEPGFDAAAISLVGKVEGDPPFKGTLCHKGWRLTKANLPALSESAPDVICPAVVEL